MKAFWLVALLGVVACLVLIGGPAAAPGGSPASAPASQPTPAPAADAQVDAAWDYLLVGLPKETAKLAGDDKDLSRLGEALDTAGKGELDKTSVHVVEKVPFIAAAEAVGLVADSKTPQVIVPVQKGIEHLWVLFAVLDPPKEPLAQLTILREDGVPTRIKLVVGENAAPCVGPWEGKIEPRKDAHEKVKTVLETKAKDGTAVRLLLMDWYNDNQWYNLTDVKFKLLDEKAKTRVVVLGVTGANKKK